MRILALTVIALLVAAAFAGSVNEKRSCPQLDIVQDISENSDDAPSLHESEANATIHGIVDESGLLRDVRIIRASSPEAGDWLIHKVEAMKFKPRPHGCGPLEYEVKVNVARK